MHPTNQSQTDSVSSAFNVSDPLGLTRVRVQSPESDLSVPPAIQSPRRVPGSERLAEDFRAYTGWLNKNPSENDSAVEPRVTEAETATPPQPAEAASVEPVDAEHVHYVPAWKAAIADQISTALEAPHATRMRPARKAVAGNNAEVAASAAENRIDAKHDLLQRINRFNRLASKANGVTTERPAKPEVPTRESAGAGKGGGIQRVDDGHGAAGVSGITMPPNIDPSKVDQLSFNHGVQVLPGGNISAQTQVRIDEQHDQDDENHLLELTEEFVRKQTALKNQLAVSANGNEGIPVFESTVGTATVDAPSRKRVRRKRSYSVRNSPVSGGTSQATGQRASRTTASVSFAPGSATPGNTTGGSTANADFREHFGMNTGEVNLPPVNVVSWDVDDFLWPAAIDPLTKVASASQLLKATDILLKGDANRLAVTSPVRGHGSTTIAMVLAKTIAASKRNVLLVDADLGSPALSRRLGIPINYSWLDLINGNRHPGDAIIRSTNSGVCVLPLAGILTRVNWPRFFYDSLSPIVDKVRSHFDAVIFDIGPLDQLTNELSSAERLVDAALVVHDPARSGGTAITRKALAGFGVQKVVFAENFIP
ncbi:MAG: hypothetical protein AAF456_06870 [Planctomycetota bacterium]